MAFELVQRENGLWVILHRTGRKASAVETGHLDREIAALDLASYAKSRTLSPTGQGWLNVADTLARNMKVGRYKRSRQQHDILGRTDVLRLLQKQDYRCAVSGSYFTHDAFDGEPRHPFQPSVDRRDPAIGYTADNVRIVCLLVNVAMGEWGEGPLRKIAERITRPALRPDNAPSAIVGRKRLRLTSCEIAAFDGSDDAADDNAPVSHSLARRPSGDTDSLELQGISRPA